MTTHNPFQIFGPFEVNKPDRIYERPHQRLFWESCDNQHPGLSEAKGLYVFSIRNRTNFAPAYVGITSEQTFSLEVFNAKNKVMILGPLSKQRGVLCLHFLAKPNGVNSGFSKNVSKKTLIWTEMFLIQLCMRKNPELLNLKGAQFLETTSIESVTDGIPTKGPSANRIKTFRNAIGIDNL